MRDAANSEVLEEERQPLVLDSDDHSQEFIYPPSNRRLPVTSSRSGSFQNILFLLASVSTVLTSVLAFYVFVNRDTYGAPPPQIPLRRPNPYPNLEKVLKEASNATFPPVVNFPEIVIQIDTSDTSRRIREDDKGRITSIGAVYPFDRHILVSSEVSTILHFRHLDFAMEDCVLQYIPPPPGAAGASPPPTVEIWVLEASSEISPWLPESWHSAPKRNHQLGSLLLSDSPMNSTHFECPTNEFTTLELSCPVDTPNCLVDFWQNKMKKHRSGIFLTQHTTHTKFKDSQ